MTHSATESVSVTNVEGGPITAEDVACSGVRKHSVRVAQGMDEDEKNVGGRLQLLHEVSGAFRPGVLTALVGVSGAGKTTLMDVLAGRKTGTFA